jgi:thiol-disulfide isomerase/thioredoxin
VLYVDFWASWCPPCRKGMPQLNDLRNAYKEKGFEIIAINLDEDISDAIKFLNDVKVDYPVAYDPSGQISEKYEVIGLPQAFLIGRDGEIKHIHQGFRKGDIDKLRAIVDKLTN